MALLPLPFLYHLEIPYDSGFEFKEKKGYIEG